MTLTGQRRQAASLVTLGSDSAAAVVAASVTVPAGATTATFPVTTFAVDDHDGDHVGVAGGATATATLTVAGIAVASLASIRRRSPEEPPSPAR